MPKCPHIGNERVAHPPPKFANKTQQKRDKNERNVYYNSITVRQPVPGGYIALYWRRSSCTVDRGLFVRVCASGALANSVRILHFITQMHESSSSMWRMKKTRRTKNCVRSWRNGKTFIILFLSIAWFRFAFAVVNLHNSHTENVYAFVCRVHLCVYASGARSKYMMRARCTLHLLYYGCERRGEMFDVFLFLFHFEISLLLYSFYFGSRASARRIFAPNCTSLLSAGDTFVPYHAPLANTVVCFMHWPFNFAPRNENEINSHLFGWYRIRVLSKAFLIYDDLNRRMMSECLPLHFDPVVSLSRTHQTIDNRQF